MGAWSLVTYLIYKGGILYENWCMRTKKREGTGLDMEKLSSLVQEHQGEKSVEGLAQILLQMGYTPEMLKKASLKDVISFQKHLLDKRKADMEEQKFQIALSKLMSGEVAFIDGAVEDAQMIDKEADVDSLPDPGDLVEDERVTEDVMTQTDGE